MKPPQYIDLDEARRVLAELGVNLTPRQMKRATDRDAAGRRKLPFFLDPIEHRLRIDRDTLINIYRQKQIEAERAASQSVRTIDINRWLMTREGDRK